MPNRQRGATIGKGYANDRNALRAQLLPEVTPYLACDASLAFYGCDKTWLDIRPYLEQNKPWIESF